MIREPVLFVSACLLGVHCRFDGDHAGADAVVKALDGRALVPICPEQLGGLATPRDPVTLMGGDGEAVLTGRARVRTETGKDVTEAFLRAVEAVMRLKDVTGASEALLKENSPSCGVRRTYVDGVRKPGMGVTAAALRRAGIEIRTEEDLQDE